jgi:glycosyltransferase involved in cell wall biosynthesis
LLHIHDIFILPQIIIGYLAILNKKPLIISPHGVLDPVRLERRSLFKKTYWLIVKPLLKNANYIIATCEKENNDLKRLGLKKTLVVYNGVLKLKVKVGKKYQHFKAKDKTTLLYIGKLHPQKGLVELLKAYRQVQNKYRLLIAGLDDGIEAKLKQYIFIHKLKDVYFLGYVDDVAKKELFQIADVFVYPSYSEGFSISILEALSEGLPVLITDSCNFPQVEERKAGWVIETTNLTQQLMVSLKKLDPSLLETFSQNARRLIDSEFSIERMTSKIEQIYESAIKI